MKVYFHSFWSNLETGVFCRILSLALSQQVVPGSFEESEIMMESLFGETGLYAKPWKYTFLFSGESERVTTGFLGSRVRDQYSCILCGKPTEGNTVNMPLYLLALDEIGGICPRPIRVPERNVVAVISNGNNPDGRNIFLDRLHEVIPIDFAGRYRNNVPRIESHFLSEAFFQEIAKYKFMVTMENSKCGTYITEKIIQGFAAGIVPIYWGSDHVETYFNPDRFIHVKSLDQDSIDAAIERIRELMEHPAKYLEMIQQPVFRHQITEEEIAGDIRKALSKTYFMTFGGPTQVFHNQVKRIMNEAVGFHTFDEVFGYTETYLQNDCTFWAKHGDFIQSNPRGYGYWIWKPYLIYERLQRINEGDFLVYCDAGCTINPGGLKRFQEYKNVLDASPLGIIAFELTHLEKTYTKRKVYTYFGSTPEEDTRRQCMATVVLIKKTARSLDTVRQWYEIASHHELINDTLEEEHPDFKDHRHDQSIWSMLVRENAVVLPDETYFGNGYWDERFPFWATRRR